MTWFNLLSRLRTLGEGVHFGNVEMRTGSPNFNRIMRHVGRNIVGDFRLQNYLDQQIKRIDPLYLPIVDGSEVIITNETQEQQDKEELIGTLASYLFVLLPIGILFGISFLSLFIRMISYKPPKDHEPLEHTTTTRVFFVFSVVCYVGAAVVSLVGFIMIDQTIFSVAAIHKRVDAYQTDLDKLFDQISATLDSAFSADLKELRKKVGDMKNISKKVSNLAIVDFPDGVESAVHLYNQFQTTIAKTVTELETELKEFATNYSFDITSHDVPLVLDQKYHQLSQVFQSCADSLQSLNAEVTNQTDDINKVHDTLLEAYNFIDKEVIPLTRHLNEQSFMNQTQAELHNLIQIFMDFINIQYNNNETYILLFRTVWCCLVLGSVAFLIWHCYLFYTSKALSKCTNIAVCCATIFFLLIISSVGGSASLFGSIMEDIDGDVLADYFVNGVIQGSTPTRNLTFSPIHINKMEVKLPTINFQDHYELFVLDDHLGLSEFLRLDSFPFHEISTEVTSQFQKFLDEMELPSKIKTSFSSFLTEWEEKKLMDPNFAVFLEKYFTQVDPKFTSIKSIETELLLQLEATRAKLDQAETQENCGEDHCRADGETTSDFQAKSEEFIKALGEEKFSTDLQRFYQKSYDELSAAYDYFKSLDTVAEVHLTGIINQFKQVAGDCLFKLIEDLNIVDSRPISQAVNEVTDIQHRLITCLTVISVGSHLVILVALFCSAIIWYHYPCCHRTQSKQVVDQYSDCIFAPPLPAFFTHKDYEPI